MAYTTTIDSALTELVTPLRQQLEEGGASNFLVLNSDPARNYYVQVAPAHGGGGLRLEAAGNQFLAAAHALSEAQATHMASMGWQRPGGGSPNFFRDEAVHTDADYGAIAQLLLRTLMEVYGMGRGDEIQVTLYLE